MKLTNEEIRANAQDWIGASDGLTNTEVVDRAELREQFTHTIADAEDIEAIAVEIEQICAVRFYNFNQ